MAGREEIPVEGIGFVTGLDGTGTKVLPPGIRQQMLDMMRRHKIEHPEEILASPDNAVVRVTGRLTPGIGQGELFDLDVRALPTTETTSLEGGFLLECELTRVASARGIEAKSEVLALGRGPVFVSPFMPDEKTKMGGDTRIGRVLAGGKVAKTRHFQLTIEPPSARTAEHVVRLINTRFPDAAKGGQDPGRVSLEVPPDFQDDKAHFLDLVGAIYMRETADARDLRLNLLIDSLQAGRDLDRIVLCLEAIGAPAIPRLRPLAGDANPEVRFYVGQTLAFLQDATAVRILEPMALNDASPRQQQAVEALGTIRSGVGLGVLGRALDAKSPLVRVAAWQCMAKLSARQFATRRFSDKFMLTHIATKTEPFIYVSRTLTPEVAVFGDPVIRPPVLVETRRVTVNAVAKAEELSVFTQSHGQDFRIEAPLDVFGFIAKVASPAALENNPKPQGLDLDYSDIVGLLSQMGTRKALSGPIVMQATRFDLPGDRQTARPIGEAEPEINVLEHTTPAPGSK
jgi:hypothetical protein